MAVAQSTRRLTEAEYLAIERAADTKSEFFAGEMFENYRLMPALREYLLVSQRHPHIEQFIRQGGSEWVLREASGLAASLTLASLQISLPLAEVFARVEFGEAPQRPRIKV